MHCVDLDESFQTRIYLQNLASIQPRTSPLKFVGSRDAAGPVRSAGGEPTWPRLESIKEAAAAEQALAGRDGDDGGTTLGAQDARRRWEEEKGAKIFQARCWNIFF